jgi:Holliday junction resolvase RusA-like endonuclease
MIINIKPLSVNEAWKGRRFKTDKYKQWHKELMLLLPPLKIQFKGNLKASFVFGFSTNASDIDNPLKPLIDTLQKKYSFNDNQITELTVLKKVVKKGCEFIEISIQELK